MLKKWSAALTISTATALFATSVFAQTVCGPRDKFVSHLAKKHAEQTTAMGLASNGRVVEVLSAENGSWTIIITEPGGQSCVVAAGEAWEAIQADHVAMKPAA